MRLDRVHPSDSMYSTHATKAREHSNASVHLERHYGTSERPHFVRSPPFCELLRTYPSPKWGHRTC